MKYTFKDICTKIGSGATPTGGKEAYKGGDYALVRSQNVLDYTFTTSGLAYINETQAKKLDGVKVESGDVLLNITGDSVARACIIPDEILPARVNQHVAIIRANNQYALNEYLLYFLQYNKQYLLSISQGGGTRSAITKKMIEDIEIDLPSIEDQLAIVNIINTISKKIEVNQQINDNLEQQAKALYKSWFVDFEPFKEGKFIESELGVVPEGWSIGKIEDLTTRMASGGTPKSMNPDFYSGDICWFTTKELTDGFLIDSEKHISQSAIENSAAKVFPKGSVLMAIYAAPTVGRLGILSCDAAFNQAAVALIPKTGIGPGYIYLTLYNERNNFNNLSSGAAQQNLNVGLVRNYPTCIPPQDVLADFENKILPIFNNIERNQIEISNLTTLRDTLLPKLMSGELKINEIDC